MQQFLRLTWSGTPRPNRLQISQEPSSRQSVRFVCAIVLSCYSARPSARLRLVLLGATVGPPADSPNLELSSTPRDPSFVGASEDDSDHFLISTSCRWRV